MGNARRIARLILAGNIEPEDYTLTPSGSLGSLISVGQVEGDHLGEFPSTEEALAAVRNHMSDQQFWPDIWWISDHGNYWPIDAEGNELKNDAEDVDDNW